MYNHLSFRSACSKQGKGVRRRRGESYHKREGWDKEIGVRSEGVGNKFFIPGSSGYYLNAPGYNETQRKTTTCAVAKPLVLDIVIYKLWKNQS